MRQHLPALMLQGAISMSIYSPIVITEQIRASFKPTRLYIKELAGIKYFGKTISLDASKYTGSGTRWTNQIQKYGKENIKTLWVSEWFLCPEDIQEFALLFSELNQIVESNEWANLVSENGIDGGKRENNHLKIYNQLPRTDCWRKAQLAGHKQFYENRTGPGNRSKKVLINDVMYESYTDASIKLNKSWQTIHNWVKNGKAIIL